MPVSMPVIWSGCPDATAVIAQHAQQAPLVNRLTLCMETSLRFFAVVS